jgi:hypothetical protein
MADGTIRNSENLTERMFDVEEATQALRREYYPRFEKALGAKRAAKFYQVDNRLSLMVTLQLARKSRSFHERAAEYEQSAECRYVGWLVG